MLEWILPYQFSWLAVTIIPAAVALYALGMQRLIARGETVGIARPAAFFLGALVCYIVLHTRFDYYGQFLFFMHRAQHLVLHHAGAMLIALGNPVRVWRAGLSNLPEHVPARVKALLAKPVHVLQHPIMGSIVFVGLIFFWLTPSIHFDAMLSHPLYLVMNWSMFIDGVLFWLVIVDPRSPVASRLPRFGIRIAMIVATMIPQIILGAYITFSRQDLYDVYAVCGRAWPISAATDQIWGGLLTWIPPAMMQAIAGLVVLSMILKQEREETVQAT